MHGSQCLAMLLDRVVHQQERRLDLGRAVTPKSSLGGLRDDVKRRSCCMQSREGSRRSTPPKRRPAPRGGWAATPTCPRERYTAARASQSVGLRSRTIRTIDLARLSGSWRTEEKIREAEPSPLPLWILSPLSRCDSGNTQISLKSKDGTGDRRRDVGDGKFLRKVEHSSALGGAEETPWPSAPA